MIISPRPGMYVRLREGEPNAGLRDRRRGVAIAFYPDLDLAAVRWLSDRRLRLTGSQGRFADQCDYLTERLVQVKDGL